VLGGGRASATTSRAAAACCNCHLLALPAASCLPSRLGLALARRRTSAAPAACGGLVEAVAV